MWFKVPREGSSCFWIKWLLCANVCFSFYKKHQKSIKFWFAWISERNKEEKLQQTYKFPKETYQANVADTKIWGKNKSKNSQKDDSLNGEMVTDKQ